MSRLPSDFYGCCCCCCVLDTDNRSPVCGQIDRKPVRSTCQGCTSESVAFVICYLFLLIRAFFITFVYIVCSGRLEIKNYLLFLYNFLKSTLPINLIRKRKKSIQNPMNEQNNISDRKNLTYIV